MKKIYLFLLFLPLLSCNDWLDISPENSVTLTNYFQSEADLESLHTSMMARMKSACKGKQPYYYMSVDADELKPNISGFRELEVAAYCGCQYCIGRSDTYVTWSGRLPTQGTTVAADLNGFEIGDVLRIGSDIYRVEDKVSPGAREALCLYFSNHADAIAFGRQILPVFKIKSREEHLGEPLGIFEVTGYCGCEKCCGLKGGLTKAEKIPKAGHTIAADPEVLPMESKVEINDIVYVVEDTGKVVKGNVIDIYFNTHEEAVRFGRQKINVYLVP